jgi:hypothetical protein
MTLEEAYAIGFLSRCADEGMAPGDVRQRVKAAFSLSALAKLGPLAALGGLAVGGTALGAGYGAGRLAGAVASDPLGAEEAKARDLINLYKVLRLKAQQQRQLHTGEVSDPAYVLNS